MTETNTIILEAARYVSELLVSKIPLEYHYHTLEHTIEVVENARAIGEAVGLNEPELEVLLLAAWLHDCGYVWTYKGHEEKGCQVALEFLRRYHYPEKATARVIDCILATQVPQIPKTLVEQVLCDADLLYLGTDDFEKWSTRLRSEWAFSLKRQFTDREWLKVNLDFLYSHSYHTEHVLGLYEPKRRKNILHLETLYASML